MDAAAHAHARLRAMREYPAVEVRRDRAVIDHVAAAGVVAAGFGRGDDLVVGDDIGNSVPARDLGARHVRARTIGADDEARRQRGALARGLVAIGDARAACVAFDAHEGPGHKLRALADGAVAQEGVEMLAVDHADKAVVDGDVYMARRRRDHASTGDPRDDLLVGDREVGDQPRRDRAAAGLDAPGPVKQRHPAARARQIGCRRRPGRPATHHHDIVGHRVTPRARVAGGAAGPAAPP